MKTILRTEYRFNIALRNSNKEAVIQVWATNKTEALVLFMDGAYMQNPFFQDYAVKEVTYDLEDGYIVARHFVDVYGLEFEYEYLSA